MRFLDQWFPFVVVLHAGHFDETEMKEMAKGYESFFRRNERYAVLTVSPGNSVRMGARERRWITDWVNEPQVKENAKRLCVGSATVLPSAAARYGMTALLWFWSPPSPFLAVSTVEEGLAFCARRLTAEKVLLGRTTDSVGRELTALLLGMGSFSPSLARRSGDHPL
jgi:hypothetical protein